LPGFEFGENTIVGANSFVNKNLKPNSIYYGTPAKRDI
jgi:acetyltransferase-like isoleucine patch superfamily enzyme